MAGDVDQESKTEEATPKKLEQLREKGTVAKSADVAGAATVIAVVLYLISAGGAASQEVMAFAARIFRLGDVRDPLVALEAGGRLLFAAVLPTAAAAAIAAVAVTLLQTKGLFAIASLQPKPERMDPLQGIKKILPGPEMGIETGKSLLKVGAITILVWRIIEDALPRFVTLPSVEPEAAAAEVGAIAGKLIVYGVASLIVLAAIDYFIAWRKFRKEAMMEKHEIKEEHKQAEGDPHVKAKRKAKAREMAQARGAGDVKDATCIVTNPTHISVALRYDPEKDAAPMMLAVGVDAVAMRMRVRARKFGIPIIENKPLARALQASGKPGQVIPFELYEQAAKIIAHILSIGGSATGGKS